MIEWLDFCVKPNLEKGREAIVVVHFKPAPESFIALAIQLFYKKPLER